MNKHMAIRGLGLALAVLTALVMLPAGALAAGTEANPIVININNVSVNGSGFTFSNDIVTITENGYYTFTGTGSATAKRIVVQSGLTDVNITLSGVNIDVGNTINYCAFDMSGATVNLTLQGDNTLESGTNGAGLHVPGGAKLTIYGPGSLSATSAYGGAGIGGNSGEDGGDITITGGRYWR